MKKSIIFIIFITIIIFILTSSALAVDCSTTGTSIANGLITAQQISGTIVNSSGACAIDPKVQFNTDVVPSFDSLKIQYYDSPAKGGVSKPPLTTGNKTYTDISTTNCSDYSDNLYLVQGNLDLTGPVGGTQTKLVFVTGNLTIGNSTYTQVTYPSSTTAAGTAGIVYIVKGDVNIYKDVTQIDGMIISDGFICTAYDGTTCGNPDGTPFTAKQLNIYGSLVSLNDQKPIRFKRQLLNNKQPVEVINHQVKYLAILKNVLADSTPKWSEIDASTAVPTPGPNPITPAAPPPASTGTGTGTGTATSTSCYTYQQQCHDTSYTIVGGNGSCGNLSCPANAPHETCPVNTCHGDVYGYGGTCTPNSVLICPSNISEYYPSQGQSSVCGTDNTTACNTDNSLKTYYTGTFTGTVCTQASCGYPYSPSGNQSTACNPACADANTLNKYYPGNACSQTNCGYPPAIDCTALDAASCHDSVTGYNGISCNPTAKTCPANYTTFSGYSTSTQSAVCGSNNTTACNADNTLKTYYTGTTCNKASCAYPYSPSGNQSTACSPACANSTTPNKYYSGTACSQTNCPFPQAQTCPDECRTTSYKVFDGLTCDISQSTTTCGVNTAIKYPNNKIAACTAASGCIVSAANSTDAPQGGVDQRYTSGTVCAANDASCDRTDTSLRCTTSPSDGYGCTNINGGGSPLTYHTTTSCSAVNCTPTSSELTVCGQNNSLSCINPTVNDSRKSFHQANTCTATTCGFPPAETCPDECRVTSYKIFDGMTCDRSRSTTTCGVNTSNKYPNNKLTACTAASGCIVSAANSTDAPGGGVDQKYTSGTVCAANDASCDRTDTSLRCTTSPSDGYGCTNINGGGSPLTYHTTTSCSAVNCTPTSSELAVCGPANSTACINATTRRTFHAANTCSAATCGFPAAQTCPDECRTTSYKVFDGLTCDISQSTTTCGVNTSIKYPNNQSSACSWHGCTLLDGGTRQSYTSGTVCRNGDQLCPLSSTQSDVCGTHSILACNPDGSRKSFHDGTICTAQTCGYPYSDIVGGEPCPEYCHTGITVYNGAECGTRSKVCPSNASGSYPPTNSSCTASGCETATGSGIDAPDGWGVQDKYTSGTKCEYNDASCQITSTQSRCSADGCTSAAGGTQITYHTASSCGVTGCPLSSTFSTQCSGCSASARYYHDTTSCTQSTCPNNFPAEQSCPATCHIDDMHVYSGSSCTQTKICPANNLPGQVCPSTCHSDTQYVPDGACGQTTCFPTAPPNLAAYFDFNETTGYYAYDSSPNGNTATLMNNPSWVTSGRIGGAINFSSANQIAVLQSPVSLAASDYTITAWINFPLPTTTGWWRTLTRGNLDHQVLIAGDNSLGVYDNATGSGFRWSGYFLNPAAGWHHLAAVGTGSNTRFYLDGNYIATSSFKSNADIRFIGNLSDGATPPGGGGQNIGLIDDVRIYQRALSDGEIQIISRYSFSSSYQGACPAACHTNTQSVSDAQCGSSKACPSNVSTNYPNNQSTSCTGDGCSSPNGGTRDKYTSGTVCSSDDADCPLSSTSSTQCSGCSALTRYYHDAASCTQLTCPNNYFGNTCYSGSADCTASCTTTPTSCYPGNTCSKTGTCPNNYLAAESCPSVCHMGDMYVRNGDACEATKNKLCSANPPITQTHTIANEFSATQGANNWHYYYSAYWTGITPMNWFTSGSGGGRTWFGDGFSCCSSSYMHINNSWSLGNTSGGVNEVPYIYWKAPSAGNVTMTVTEKRPDYKSGSWSDGFTFKIGYASSVGSSPTELASKFYAGYTNIARESLSATTHLNGNDAIVYYKHEAGSANDESLYTITIEFTPDCTETHTIANEFSNVQGKNNWYYHYYPDGASVFPATYTDTYNTYWTGEQAWTKPSSWLHLSATRSIPETFVKGLIYWKAPSAGLATMTVTVQNPDDRGAGYRAAIRYAPSVGAFTGSDLSSVSPPGFDKTTTYTISGSQNMAGNGDALLFYVDSLGNTFADAVNYTISINFRSP